jgi:hypothetical protein
VIVFNASEPAGNSIQLEQLILNLFRADGTVYYTATLDPVWVPTLFTDTSTGVGNAGFSFRLDTTQASEVNVLGVLASDRVGVEASASLYAGGLETFSLGNASQLSGIPEPSSFLSLGLGLVSLGLIGSRRRLRR